MVGGRPSPQSSNPTYAVLPVPQLPLIFDILRRRVSAAAFSGVLKRNELKDYPTSIVISAVSLFGRKRLDGSDCLKVCAFGRVTSPTVTVCYYPLAHRHCIHGLPSYTSYVSRNYTCVINHGTFATTYDSSPSS